MFFNIVYYMIKYTLKINCCSSTLQKNASLIRQGMREDLQQLWQGEEYNQNIFKLKNYFKQIYNL